MEPAKNLVPLRSLWLRYASTAVLVLMCSLGGAMTSETNSPTATTSVAPTANIAIAMAPTIAPTASATATIAIAPTPTVAAPNTMSQSEAAVGKIQLLLALVWEGQDLSQHNLSALAEFREQHRDLSVVHLVSPAYFTKAKADKAAVTATLRSLIQPQDQIVVLLGGWKSLVAEAGVIYRQAPTFWSSAVTPGDCAIDCGSDVPLNIYPDSDIAKILAKGLSTLAANGFERPIGVSVQGWMASPQLYEAAVRAGLKYDLSAVAPDLLSKRLKYYPIYAWARALWPDLTPHSQPFKVITDAGSITEIPLSLASMDYLTSKDVDSIFQEYLQHLQQTPNRDLVFPLVLHQETAMATVPILSASLQKIFAAAALEHVQMASMRLPESVPSPWDVDIKKPQQEQPAPQSAPVAPINSAIPVAH